MFSFHIAVMAVMLVLVLLGSGMVTCGDTSPDLTSAVIQYSDDDYSAPQYGDTCRYSEGYDRCGDWCTSSNDCECGNTTINIQRDAQQCCVPAEASHGRRDEGVVTEDRQCSGRDYSYNVKCAGGVVIGIHDLCHVIFNPLEVLLLAQFVSL